MVEGISIREFARRDGCSEKLVRRKIESGHLQALPSGKLDPALVGSGWRQRPAANVERSAKGADTPQVSALVSAVLSAVSARDDETLDEAAERLAPTMLSQFATKADAEKAKETYLALLRKLELDEKSGEVIKVSEVASIIGTEYAKVRSPLGSHASGGGQNARTGLIPGPACPSPADFFLWWKFASANHFCEPA